MSDDNDLDVFESGSDESTGESLEAPPSTPDSGSENDSKRIDDLMSKWQKAEARARKAEAQLKAPKADGGDADGDPKPRREIDEWMAVAREFTVDQIYRSDPRFERYGIERSRLAGMTPDEIRANAETLTKLVDAIETRARNDALLEHGITPDSAGGGVDTKLANVASMPDDEFEQLVARAKAGGFTAR